MVDESQAAPPPEEPSPSDPVEPPASMGDQAGGPPAGALPPVAPPAGAQPVPHPGGTTDAAAPRQPAAAARPPAGQPEESPTEPRDPWLGGQTTWLHPVLGGTGAPPPIGPPARTAAGPGGQEARQPRWAGRANVPPPAPPVPGEASWPPQEPRGAWWMPILIGIVGLVLLGLIGLGLWLALHGQHSPAPGPSSTPAGQASSPTPSPTPSPSASPSLSPSPSPATVTLPNLRGVPVDAAQQELQQLGLTTQVTTQVDGTVPVGTVLATQPGAGSSVPVGSQIVLTVAAAPSASAVPSAVASASGSASPGT